MMFRDWFIDGIIQSGLSPRSDDDVTTDGWRTWCVYWLYLKKPSPSRAYADLARRIQIAALARTQFTRVYRGLALTPSAGVRAAAIPLSKMPPEVILPRGASYLVQRVRKTKSGVTFASLAVVDATVDGVSLDGAL